MPRLESRPVLGRLVASCLAAALAVALCACGNVGKYNAAEVAGRAAAYYNGKYGEAATVVGISEETGSGLFGAYSLNNFFCTMSDGSVVYYERGDERADDLFMDNRQSAEILSIYIAYLREFEQEATQRFVDAGYEATFEFEHWHGASDEKLAEFIAYEEWSSGDEDFSGSYFHTRLDGQGEGYVLEEKPYSSVRLQDCSVYLSGPDAEYAGALPTNVPEAPAWQSVADAVVKDIETFAGSIADIEVYQAPDGTSDAAEALLGKGYINGYGDSWIIYDYVEVDEGIWIASGDVNLRFSADDFVLTEVTGELTFEELMEGRSDLASYTPSAYKACTLRLTDEAVARAQVALAEHDLHGTAWTWLSFAFDEASVARADGSPYPSVIRLYSVEKNANKGKDDERDFDLSTITYSQEPLPNGMVTGTEAIYLEDELLIVRL